MGASQWISRLLSEGHCVSQVDGWMNRIRTCDSFYQRTKVAKGVETAEAELGEVVAGRNYREIATSIEPIVRSIGVLAEVGRTTPRGPMVALIDDCSKIDFPSVNKHGKLIVAWNDTPSPCRHEDVTNLPVWSSYSGSLMLKAVTISFDTFQDRIVRGEVSLGLALERMPANLQQYEVGADAFQVIGVQPDGNIFCDTQSEAVRKGDALRHALGFESKRSGMRYSGGELEHHIGFPGAFEYLLKHLPSLANYLDDIAKLYRN